MALFKGRARKALKKFSTKVKTGVNKAAQKARFVPLMPFKGAMVKLLKKKGVKVSKSDDIVKISVLFHDVVLKGKNRLEYKNYAEETEGSAVETLLSNPNAVGAILAAITGFFNLVKSKTAAGAPMSEDEKAAAEEVKTEEVKEEGKNETNWMLYVGIAVAAIILLTVLKKK